MKCWIGFHEFNFQSNIHQHCRVSELWKLPGGTKRIGNTKIKREIIVLKTAI
jgi:hypothetical protein